MAPELFSGATPSIKTDLFSLGVTLFYFLTREHPYFGPDTNGRYSSQLRYKALAKIIYKRGPRLGGARHCVEALQMDARWPLHEFYRSIAPDFGHQSDEATLAARFDPVILPMLTKLRRELAAAAVLKGF
jgi:serine/threonine protein kinase